MRISMTLAFCFMSCALLMLCGMPAVSAASPLSPRETFQMELSEAVTEVDVRGTLNVDVGPAATGLLTMTVPPEQRQYVTVTRRGSVLSIEPAAGAPKDLAVVDITLRLPKLERFVVRGQYAVNIHGFSGDSISLMTRGSGTFDFAGQYSNVQIAAYGTSDVNLDVGNSASVKVNSRGTGTISLKGETAKLEVVQRGLGNLKAEWLQADLAYVEQRGTGSSAVSALRSVEINSHGTGKVYVAGNPPARRVTKSGSGGVVWLEAATP